MTRERELQYRAEITTAALARRADVPREWTTMTITDPREIERKAREAVDRLDRREDLSTSDLLAMAQALEDLADSHARLLEEREGSAKREAGLLNRVAELREEADAAAAGARYWAGFTGGHG